MIGFIPFPRVLVLCEMQSRPGFELVQDLSTSPIPRTITITPQCTSNLQTVIWYQVFLSSAEIINKLCANKLLMLNCNCYIENDWSHLTVCKQQISTGSFRNVIIFTNPSARAVYDTRSIFKWSLIGLNSEFSFF